MTASNEGLPKGDDGEQQRDRALSGRHRRKMGTGRAVLTAAAAGLTFGVGLALPGTSVLHPETAIHQEYKGYTPKIGKDFESIGLPPNRNILVTDPEAITQSAQQASTVIKDSPFAGLPAVGSGERLESRVNALLAGGVKPLKDRFYSLVSYESTGNESEIDQRSVFSWPNITQGSLTDPFVEVDQQYHQDGTVVNKLTSFVNAGGIQAGNIEPSDNYLTTSEAQQIAQGILKGQIGQYRLRDNLNSVDKYKNPTPHLTYIDPQTDEELQVFLTGRVESIRSSRSLFPDLNALTHYRDQKDRVTQLAWGIMGFGNGQGYKYAPGSTEGDQLNLNKFGFAPELQRYIDTIFDAATNPGDPMDPNGGYFTGPAILSIRQLYADGSLKLPVPTPSQFNAPERL